MPKLSRQLALGLSSYLAWYVPGGRESAGPSVPPTDTLAGVLQTDDGSYVITDADTYVEWDR